jgi:8-oxo-dGTP diphosphatase
MQLVVGVALVHDGRVLAARRSYPAESAGRWEFPGGKVDDDETPEDALVREIAEELGCSIAVTGWLEPQVQIRPGLVLRVATASLVDGEPIPREGEHDAVRWLRRDQLDVIDWLEADRPFTDALRSSAVEVGLGGAH